MLKVLKAWKKVCAIGVFYSVRSIREKFSYPSRSRSEVEKPRKERRRNDIYYKCKRFFFVNCQRLSTSSLRNDKKFMRHVKLRFGMKKGQEQHLSRLCVFAVRICCFNIKGFKGQKNFKITQTIDWQICIVACQLMFERNFYNRRNSRVIRTRRLGTKVVIMCGLY